MRDFKTLRVWEKAHVLVLAVYQAAASFPKDEMYGLTSQVRRSAASIPANIAEGCGRDGEPELVRFFNIAMGSASELEYHLLLARDLKFLPDKDHERLSADLVDVKRMLTAFIRTVKPKQFAERPARKANRLKADG
jgi:four helix bundle protein